MNNIRLLNQNDLDSYIELMKFGHHNYEWDRYYLENVGIDRLKTILSNHTDYWNIFGAFEDDELVATCTLKQMNYVGKCHKAILENNFVKNNDEYLKSIDEIHSVFEKIKVINELQYSPNLLNKSVLNLNSNTRFFLSKFNPYLLKNIDKIKIILSKNNIK